MHSALAHCRAARRRPLCFLAALLACGALPVSARAQPISHGPILGRLSSDGIGIWARTGHPGAFRVRYGLAADRLDWLSAPVPTTLARDNTGWLHLTGLEAGARYYYQLAAEGAVPPVASFRTLPSPEDLVDGQHNPRGLFNFSFEFACGNKQLDSDQPAFRTMLRELDGRIDFAIQNGDWLYEEERDHLPAEWLRRSGGTSYPRMVEIAPTIAGVWRNYQLYLERGADMAAWHREVPSFFVFDDHEILGDVNGAGTIGLRARRPAFRDIGVQGWYDYLGWSNPVPHSQPIFFGKARLEAGSAVLRDVSGGLDRLDLDLAATLTVHWGEPDAGVNIKDLDERGGDPNAGVYAVEQVIDDHSLMIRPPARASSVSSYSIGRLSYWSRSIANTEFFFLDTRSHRQVHDITDPFKAGVSMLGERQKRWLKAGMQASEADFLFVVSSVNLMVPHVGPGMAGPNKDEAWTAVAAERNELIDFWSGLGRPVLVLTGDLHNSIAVRVTDSVWEFASGPHSSRNHPLVSEAGRPPNGRFESRGREAEILWSTFFLDDSAPAGRSRPVYCVIRINNVFEVPDADGRDRWVAYPRPQAVVQYYDGLTGELLFAESVLASPPEA